MGQIDWSKYQPDYTSIAKKKPKEEERTWFQTLAPPILRGAGGIAADLSTFTGPAKPLLGAAASGAGEYLGQMAEGRGWRDVNKKTVAGQAALGMIPFGRSASALKAAAKAAGFGVAGEAAYQQTEGWDEHGGFHRPSDPELKNILASGGISGIAGGALHGLFNRGAKPEVPRSDAIDPDAILPPERPGVSPIYDRRRQLPTRGQPIQQPGANVIPPRQLGPGPAPPVVPPPQGQLPRGPGPRGLLGPAGPIITPPPGSNVSYPLAPPRGDDIQAPIVGTAQPPVAPAPVVPPKVTLGRLALDQPVSPKGKGKTKAKPPIKGTAYNPATGKIELAAPKVEIKEEAKGKRPLEVKGKKGGKGGKSTANEMMPGEPNIEVKQIPNSKNWGLYVDGELREGFFGRSAAERAAENYLREINPAYKTPQDIQGEEDIKMMDDAELQRRRDILMNREDYENPDIGPAIKSIDDELALRAGAPKVEATDFQVPEVKIPNPNNIPGIESPRIPDDMLDASNESVARAHELMNDGHVTEADRIIGEEVQKIRDAGYQDDATELDEYWRTMKRNYFASEERIVSPSDESDAQSGIDELYERARQAGIDPDDFRSPGELADALERGENMRRGTSIRDNAPPDAGTLSERLKKLNPIELRTRWNELTRKLEAETITPEESTERRLIDRMFDDDRSLLYDQPLSKVNEPPIKESDPNAKIMSAMRETGSSERPGKSGYDYFHMKTKDVTSDTKKKLWELGYRVEETYGENTVIRKRGAPSQHMKLNSILDDMRDLKYAEELGITDRGDIFASLTDKLDDLKKTHFVHMSEPELEVYDDIVRQLKTKLPGEQFITALERDIMPRSTRSLAVLQQETAHLRKIVRRAKLPRELKSPISDYTTPEGHPIQLRFEDDLDQAIYDMSKSTLGDERGEALNDWVMQTITQGMETLPPDIDETVSNLTRYINKIIDGLTSTVEPGGVFNVPAITDSLKRLFEEETGTWNIGAMNKALKDFFNGLDENPTPRTATGGSNIPPSPPPPSGPRVSVGGAGTPPPRRPSGRTPLEVNIDMGKALPEEDRRGWIRTQLANFREGQTALDLSFAFRQGINNVHRKEFWKAFEPMFSSVKSQADFERVNNVIKQHSKYKMAEDAGIEFTEFSDDPAKYRKRDEGFRGTWIEELPLGIGTGIKRTGGAFHTFGNKLRMDLFSSLVDDARGAGIDVSDSVAGLKNLKGIARYVNDSTGRSRLTALGHDIEGMAPLLNDFLFAPKLIRSRMNMMKRAYQGVISEALDQMGVKNPRGGGYKGSAMGEVHPALAKQLRREAMKSMMAVGGLAATSAGLSSQVFDSPEAGDVRSTDFGKIKTKGGTRLDFTGGYQQYVRAAAQAATGTVRTDKGIQNKDALDTLTRFGRYKLSPAAAYIADWLAEETVTGEKFGIEHSLADAESWEVLPEDLRNVKGGSLVRGVAEMITPLIIQDMFEIGYRDIPTASVTTPASFFGVGVRSYGEVPEDEGKGITIPPVRTPRARTPQVIVR